MTSSIHQTYNLTRTPEKTRPRHWTSGKTRPQKKTKPPILDLEKADPKYRISVTQKNLDFLWINLAQVQTTTSK